MTKTRTHHMITSLIVVVIVTASLPACVRFSGPDENENEAEPGAAGIPQGYPELRFGGSESAATYDTDGDSVVVQNPYVGCQGGNPETGTASFVSIATNLDYVAFKIWGTDIQSNISDEDDEYPLLSVGIGSTNYDSNVTGSESAVVVEGSDQGKMWGSFSGHLCYDDDVFGQGEVLGCIDVTNGLFAATTSACDAAAP